MSLLGKRYASALLSIADENKSIDKYRQSLKNMVYYYESVPELDFFVKNPQVNKDDKKKVLCEIMGNDVDDNFLNFVKVLVDKERMDIIADILENYEVLANEKQNIVLIKVTSAMLLDDEQIENIKQKYQKDFTESRIEIKNIVDKSIIGGIKLEIGDKIVDATLKTKLKALKEHILNGQLK